MLLDDYIDLWIIAGQSNTDGRIELSKQRPSWLPPSNIVPNVKYFNKKTTSSKFGYIQITHYSLIITTLNGLMTVQLYLNMQI